MAHIERVLIHRRTLPMIRPFVTAIRTAHTLDIVLIEVRDSNGNSGWGEVPTSWRVTGESVASVCAVINEVLFFRSHRPIDAGSDFVE